MYKGVALSVLASITFGVLYFYTQFLQPLDSEETFAWRMLSTLPFITLFMWWSGDLKHVAEIFRRVLQQPLLLLWLLISSFLCTTQLWLFLWGPINGRGLEVSLGYFLLPLVMVLVGCVLYKEKLSSWQMLAVALAVLGVGHEIWRIGSVAWETVYVALAYPLYFFLRRQFKTDNLGGFWWDLFLILPVAFYLGFVYSDSMALLLNYSHLIWAVLGLGFLSALGLGSYILASRYLPFVIFGLLSYLEPVLLAFASMMLGERVEADEWLTYIPIWLAVLLLVIEGVLHVLKQKRQERALQKNVQNYQDRLE
ncbi:EamA family transporter RarD [Acinetobacter indicus]|jgi:chloramphenicol-sensitive protein RarD|uniref:EamA family transporter RarD n=1 Tax=Acinetobacter indicus TaxID=756892 RepID=A0A6C0Y356_9GAMM|nr:MULTISPECIES: EamA family transporter RarD [Acinetobacter]ENW90460.1 protein RarD [Acinetobacter sp. CIP 53.82]MBA0155103.1 EamA family transporter RarD [Acinetobacter indicus]MCO8098764.1 EamA family transporter RarD [Acinetobacter indicus]MCO8103606.1 EamA family transporter RarD [Acinetobacter indicus]MCO8104335.1 EamA family transporter RarD [Acinetobacter indicus]